MVPINLEKDESQKRYRNKHKDLVKENKRVYDSSRDKDVVNERNRKYQHKNKDVINEYKKKWYETKKEEKKLKVNCIYGCVITKYAQRKHEQSIKHLKFIGELTK